jgi:hypothetical protein
VTRNPIPLWLAVVFIVAALLLPLLPFWIAIAIVTAFCGWAAYVLVMFRRRAVRIAAAHALFQREIDRMPRREPPTRAQVLMHLSEYPASWQPFARPRPAKGVQAHAR